MDQDERSVIDGKPDVYVYRGGRCGSARPVHIFVEVGTEVILSYAFYNCENVRSVYIPRSVKRIGAYAFWKCKSLSRVVIECDAQLDSIGDYAFQHCASLVSIGLPIRLKKVGFAAFGDCSALMEFDCLAQNLESVAPFAFSSCFPLKKVDLSSADKVRVVDHATFRGCSALEFIRLPPNLIEIRAYAFSKCFSLKDIDFPTTLVSMEAAAFQQCTALVSILFPDSTRIVGDQAFQKCQSLNKIVCSPKLLSSRFFGGWPFEGCYSLWALELSRPPPASLWPELIHQLVGHPEAPKQGNYFRLNLWEHSELCAPRWSHPKRDQ